MFDVLCACIACKMTGEDPQIVKEAGTTGRQHHQPSNDVGLIHQIQPTMVTSRAMNPESESSDNGNRLAGLEYKIIALDFKMETRIAGLEARITALEAAVTTLMNHDHMSIGGLLYSELHPYWGRNCA